MFYGEEVVNAKDLVEANVKRIIKLQYYEIEQKIDNKIEYGIEVTKKEYMNTNILEETEKINFVTDNKQKIDNLMNLIKRNKVTPVLLCDTINDLIKIE